MRPTEEQHPKYYNYYIQLISQENVLSALVENKKTSLDFIKSIPTKLEDYAYENGKWTIKQLLLHCIDTERIISTRALTFARGELQKPLSFDENLYANNSHANLRSINDIADEFEAVRNASTVLFKSFSNEILCSLGNTPSGLATINSIGFFICGHTQHHLNIIKERYLKNNSSIKN